MRRSLYWVAVGCLIGALILALLGCTVHLVTVNLPQEPGREAATSQPSKSFMDRVLEDLQ